MVKCVLARPHFVLVGFFGGSRAKCGFKIVRWELSMPSVGFIGVLGAIEYSSRSKMVVNENDCIVAWLMSDTLLHLIKAFYRRYNTG